MEQELALATLVSFNNDLLEAVYEIKSDVICNSLPPGCAKKINKSSINSNHNFPL